MKLDRYINNIERIDEGFSYTGALISFIFALIKFLFIMNAFKKYFNEKRIANSWKNLKKSEELTNILQKVIKDPTVEVYTYEDNDMNACALSSGKIYVSSEILFRCTKDEIIAIMLHEYGHFKNKDHKTSKLIKNSSLLTIDFLTIILSGIFPKFLIVFNMYSIIAGIILGDTLVGKYRKISELNADSTATKYGYGAAMASALQKIKDQVIEEMKVSLNSDDVEYINSVFKEQSRAANYPTMEERIANILKELNNPSYAKLSFSKFFKIISSKFFSKGKSDEATA